MKIKQNPDPRWEVSSRGAWSGETEEIRPGDAVKLVESLVRQLAGSSWEELSPGWASSIAATLFSAISSEKASRILQDLLPRFEVRHCSFQAECEWFKASEHNDPAFLDAILESPDDDAPRLRYAQHLRKRKNPRGEFIEVQIALSSGSPSAEQRDTLRQREAQLLEAHGAAWSVPLHDATFVRGFVERGRCKTARDWCDAVEQRPALKLVRAVGVAIRDVSDAEALAASPSLAGLVALDLRDCLLKDDELSALLQSPHLTNLVELDLRQNDLTNKSATRLAEAALGKLASLNLRSNSIDGEGARELMRSPLLASLRHLTLNENLEYLKFFDLLPAGELLRSRFTPIKENALDLSDLELERGQFDDLMGAPQMLDVHRLSLSGTPIDHHGPGETLAGSPNLENLIELDLSRNGIDDEQAAALASSPYLARLEILKLSDNEIGPSGARALASSPSLAQLEALDLSRNPLGEGGARQLAAGSGLRRLKRIECEGCGFEHDDSSMAAFRLRWR